MVTIVSGVFESQNPAHDRAGCGETAPGLSASCQLRIVAPWKYG